MELHWVLLLLEMLLVSTAARGPPRVSERVVHRQSIRLGRTMKLPCPVEGDPPPLIMWTKDGRNIHSGWTRFRVQRNALRIKEVETEDAGTYICKATNGFGSVNINYTLIVIGSSLPENLTEASLCMVSALKRQVNKPLRPSQSKHQESSGFIL